MGGMGIAGSTSALTLVTPALDIWSGGDALLALENFEVMPEIHELFLLGDDLVLGGDLETDPSFPGEVGSLSVLLRP